MPTPAWWTKSLTKSCRSDDDGSMAAVGVHEAKTHFSALLRRVAAGEEIEIQSGGRPVARLVPIAGKTKRHFGSDAGLFTVPDDFNDPLPCSHRRLNGTT